MSSHPSWRHAHFLRVLEIRKKLWTIKMPEPSQRGWKVDWFFFCLGSDLSGKGSRYAPCERGYLSLGQVSIRNWTKAMGSFVIAPKGAFIGNEFFALEFKNTMNERPCWHFKNLLSECMCVWVCMSYHRVKYRLKKSVNFLNQIKCSFTYLYVKIYL